MGTTHSTCYRSLNSQKIRDVTEPAEIRFCRMQILVIKIRGMRICWCTIIVDQSTTNTLVNFKKFKLFLFFLKFYFAADCYERL